MLFNELSRDKWEIVVFVLSFCSLSHVLSILIFCLNLAIIINKIIIDCLFAGNLSTILKLIKLSNVIKEFHFLFFLHLILCLLLTHFISHLGKMLLHDSITCQFILIIDSFSKSDNISWINKIFISRIAHFPDSFEFSIVSLWIWVGHVMA